jgi:hypothetical protein
VRDGVEILPSLTHVVDRAQKMYFYYEVYEPERPPAAPRLSRPACRSIAAP